MDVDGSPHSNGVSSFVCDVLDGMSNPLKRIPSKYHYDETGSRLFQEIMSLPEYYPTACELEILSTQAEKMLNLISFSGRKFKVVELGCGDGFKTIELFRTFIKSKEDFVYVPTDISEDALHSLRIRFDSSLPGIQMEPRVGDYFHILQNLSTPEEHLPTLFLFLGGNIGNMKEEERFEFLTTVKGCMQSGDVILIGFDLKTKRPSIIHSAYNDSKGVTKAFNMNLIERMRTELGMDLNPDNFDFYSSYCPVAGEVRAFLVSLCHQNVWSNVLKRNFIFKEGEAIETELSVKYSLEEIECLGRSLGLKLVDHMIDSKGYFSDTLFSK